MSKRYRWKRGTKPPPGIKLGKCYDSHPAPGPAPRLKAVCLLDNEGNVLCEATVGGQVEPCDETIPE